jgi:hypothetical protein
MDPAAQAHSVAPGVASAGLAAEAAAAATVAEAAEIEWFRREESMGRRRPGSGPVDVRAYVEAHDGVLPREVTADTEQRRLAMIMKTYFRRKDTVYDVWEGCEPLETEWLRRKDPMGKGKRRCGSGTAERSARARTLRPTTAMYRGESRPTLSSGGLRAS